MIFQKETWEKVAAYQQGKYSIDIFNQSVTPVCYKELEKLSIKSQMLATEAF